jgi:hypothetical protein
VRSFGSVNQMTLFQRKVLSAVADHEYEGAIEVAMQLHGYPTALEQHNVNRAIDKLAARGMIDLHSFTITDKARRHMNRPSPQRVTPEQLAIRTGDNVQVTMDDKTVRATRAASDPWQLGHGAWVIKLDGISGGYDLSRCKKVGQAAPSSAAETPAQ